MPYINNGGVENGLFMEELMQRTENMNGEKQRDSETREPDVVDGTPAPVEINPNCRGSVEKKSTQGTVQASERIDSLFKSGKISVLLKLFIGLKENVFYLMAYLIIVLLNILTNWEILKYRNILGLQKQNT